MAFLPGTAIATILSMGSFFQPGLKGSITISPQFWVYWSLTIPITILVFGSWQVQIKRKAKDIQKLREQPRSESLLGDSSSSGIELRTTGASSRRKFVGNMCSGLFAK